MKLHFLSYDGGKRGARNMTALIQRNAEQARRLGIYASVLTWGPSAYQGTLFYAAHKGILDTRRGAGYFLWKPYIITKRLQEIPEGDALLYLDGDCTLDSMPPKWIAHAQQNKGVAAMACHPRYSNQAMTRRDTLILLDADREPYLSAPQVMGGLIITINGKEGGGLILDWLLASCNPDVLMDDPSRLAPEYPEFKEHRTQSVLSILMQKRGMMPLPNSDNFHMQHHSCLLVNP